MARNASTGKALTKQEESFPPVSPLRAGMRCRCPRCGEGKLYAGLLAPAKQCSHCGLDYGFADADDGPAVFVILIVGAIVTLCAMALQSLFNPPVYVYVLLLGPLIVILSLASLRMAKALIIALQYRNLAAEGESEE